MPPMTASERKARERERKRAAGLVPVEVWVKAGDEDRIRQIAREMAENPLTDPKPV